MSKTNHQPPARRWPSSLLPFGWPGSLLFVAVLSGILALVRLGMFSDPYFDPTLTVFSAPFWPEFVKSVAFVVFIVVGSSAVQAWRDTRRKPPTESRDP